MLARAPTPSIRFSSIPSFDAASSSCNFRCLRRCSSSAVVPVTALYRPVLGQTRLRQQCLTPIIEAKVRQQFRCQENRCTECSQACSGMSAAYQHLLGQVATETVVVIHLRHRQTVSQELTSPLAIWERPARSSASMFASHSCSAAGLWCRPASAFDRPWLLLQQRDESLLQHQQPDQF